MNFRDHLQGDSGLVSVWSRNGMAAAFLPEAEPFATRLQGNLGDLNRLRDLALQENPGKDYLELHDKFERTLSSPEGRLLRRLAKRVDLYRLHRVNYDREMKEQATKHARAGFSIQEKLEYFELLIVSVYAFELAHLLLDKPLELWSEAGFGWLSVLVLCVPAVGVLTVYPAARRLLLDKNPTKDQSKDEEFLESGGRQLLARAGIVFGILLVMAVGLWIAFLVRNPSRENHAASVERLESLVEKQVVQIESLKTGVGRSGQVPGVRREVHSGRARRPAGARESPQARPGQEVIRRNHALSRRHRSRPAPADHRLDRQAEGDAGRVLAHRRYGFERRAMAAECPAERAW